MKIPIKWDSAIRVSLLLISINIPALCQGPSAACGPVMTNKGAVVGAAAGKGCAFKGIPYAQPPTGALRFKPPVPHDPWTGVLSTTSYGNQCAQPGANNIAVGAEDCLFLNLWAPASLSGNLPVMVWLHGGYHVVGNSISGAATWDGKYLLERFGVILVTVESRLNVLGYMAHPALDAESPLGVSGNYGFLDQVATLQWVQQNIAAFGGDPSRVTLFGVSAGGEDVALHLVSPLSKGLFSAAIMQSPVVALDAVPTLRQLEQGIGMQTATATACAAASDVAACLRALPMAELIPAVPVINTLLAPGSYVPVVDGYAIPTPPLEIIAAGLHNHVPIVIGSNADESYANVTPGSIPDEATYRSRLRQTFGNAGGDLVLAQYSSADYESPERAYVTATTDNDLTCPVRRIVRSLVNSQTDPVFRYLFTHTLGSGTTQSKRHAYHALELLFLWHDFSGLPGYSPTESEQALADSITAYWARFATSGDPNWFQTAYWPAALSWYDDVFLQLDDVVTAGRGVRSAKCDFWDAHPELSIFKGSKLE